MSSRRARMALALALALALIGGAVVAVRAISEGGRTYATAYFANSNGTYVGDHVLILGVPVGKIEKIEPQPERVKIVFWYRNKYKVPADVKALIMSPTLVTARSIQLSPVYTGGAFLPDHAVIPQDHTAVPMEWDDVRTQLDKLTQLLQPTKPGGVSTLGQFINTAAENLRGQGPDIRESIVKLSQAISAIADHSGDFFSTLKSLATLVSALRDSSVLLRRLNENLAAVTGLVANDPNEVANAIRNLNDVVDDVGTFVATNRESLGTTSDKLASVSRAVTESLDDIKQTLHIAPTTFQNFLNIYQPAQGTLSGVLGLNNFANPIQFLCGAVEAASRLGNEKSAKLCVQYLAPIMKNRQYNFLPMGLNPYVGTSARPNEITYSQDWLRPDYVPPPVNTPTPPAAHPQPVEINPASGLNGLMTPPGGGR